MEWRVDAEQNAQSNLGLYCLHMPFCWERLGIAMFSVEKSNLSSYFISGFNSIISGCSACH